MRSSLKTTVSGWGLAPALALAAVVATGSVAQATPTNEAPPPGAILDLAGQPVNQGPAIPYSVTFIAGSTTTDIAFAFREDPSYFTFTNASVVDNAAPSVNLLTNGNFTGGTYTSNGNALAPVGWTFQNQFGAEASGIVSDDTWFDGSVQAYDSIDQDISTVVGDTYTVSFDLTDDGSLTTYSDLSTNGDVTDPAGNGIDVLAYATNSTFSINAVPEPASMSMFCVALLGLGAAIRRRRAR